MYSKNELRVGVKFDVDDKQLEQTKQKLGNLTSGLQKIQENFQKASILGTANDDLKQAAEDAKKLETILSNSWNSRVGQLDLNKFNTQLKQSGLSADGLRSSFSKLGAEGAATFNNVTSSVLNTNVELKKSSGILDKMALTMANTIRFGISSSIFNTMTSSLSKAYNYAIDLDKSLNDIRIVTGKSSDEMERFAQTANRAAFNLGASTRDYTDAALIYYQQGLSDMESQRRAEITVKTANVTGQTGQEVSEQLTAIWNGYKVDAEEAELYIDKVAKVAATSAADLEEMATGMSKVASAANSAGVDIDQLNAYLATVISVTREAPETIGSSFRTIFARLGDLKLNGQDESGVSLGKVSKQLNDLGIQILKDNGDMRDMGDIIEDIAAKWQTWNQAQRQAAAIAMAGKMQYSRLIALFDNWDDKYTQFLNDSATAAGTLNEQQEIYLDSVDAHLRKVRTEAERTYDILFDTDSVNTMADALSGLLGIFNRFLEGLGGGLSSLTFIGASLANLMNKQVGAALERQIENTERMKANLAGGEVKQNFAEIIAGQYQAQGVNVSASDVRVQTEAKVAKEIYEIRKSLTQEEYNELVAIQKRLGANEELLANAREYKKTLEEINNGKFVNASVDQLKDATGKIDKNNIKPLEKQVSLLEGMRDSLYDIDKAEDNLEILNEKGFLSQDDYNTIFLGIAGDIEETEAAEERLNQIIDETNQKLEKERDNYEKLKEATSQKVFLEENEKAIDISNQEDRKRLENLKAQKERQQALSTGVQLLSTSVQLGVTLAGVLKTASDNSQPLEERLKTISVTLLTSAPMIISSLASINAGLPNLLLQLRLVETATDLETMSATEMWLAILGPIGLVVAGIGLVGGAIYGLVKAYNQAEDSAKRMEESAKKLADASEQANQELDNLKKNFEAYDSAIDALDKCVKGTQEWKDALKEANDSAIELINSLDGLSAEDIRNLYSRDENGLITFNREQRQNLLDRAESKAGSARVAAASGQLAAVQARNSADVLSTMRGNTLPLGILGAYALAPMGTNILATAAQRLYHAGEDSEIINSNLDEFETVSTLNEFKEKMNDLGVDISSFSNDELEDFKNSIESMAQQAAAAEEKLRLIAELQVQETLGEQYGADVQKVATEQLTDAQEEYVEEYNDLIDKLNITSGANDTTYKEILRQLQEAGYNYQAQKSNAVRGTDTNRSLAFLENGQEVVLNKEEISSILASIKANNEILANAQETEKELAALEENLGSIGEGLRDYITSGSLESLSPSDLKDFSEAFKNSDMRYLVDAMGLDTSGPFGEATAVNQAQRIFGSSKNIENAIDDYNMQLDDFLNHISSSAKEAFEGLGGLSDLSLVAQTSLAGVLEDAFQNGGQDALDTMVEFLKEGIPEDQIGDFANVIGQITDWSKTDINDLKFAFKEAGVEINASDEVLQAFVYSMRNVKNATAETTETLMGYYAKIHEVIDNLKRGDTISKENYAQLSDSAQEYFTQMLDGTYKLTGDAEDFYNLVEKQQIEDFQARKQELRKSFSGENNLPDSSAFDNSMLSSMAETINQVVPAQELNEDAIAEFEALDLAIASSYKNLSDLRQAFNDGTIEAQAFTKSFIELNEEKRREDFKPEEIQEYADHLQDVADEAKELADSVEDDAEVADDLAVQIMRMNKGVEDLSKNWKNWNSILQKSEKSSQEYKDALKNTRAAMADLLDMSEDSFSADFLTNNAKDISRAAEGDADAIDRLRQAALKDITLNMKLEDGALQGEDLWNRVQEIQKMIDALGPIQAGTKIDLSGMDKGEKEIIDALNKMIADAGMGANEVNKMLSGMGFTANFAKQPQKIVVKDPDTTIEHVRKVSKGETSGNDGETIEEYDIEKTVEVRPGKTHEGSVDAYAMETSEAGKTVVPKINSISKKANGAFNNSSSSNRGGSSGRKGGGGSKKGKSSSKKDKMDPLKEEADRYHKVNTQIQKVENSLKKLQSQQDKFVGKQLIENLTKQWEDLNDQITNYNKKLKIANGEQDELRKKLKKKGVTFNEDNTIKNYIDIFNKQQDNLNKAIAKYNKMSAKQQEKNKDKIEKMKKDFDEFKTNMDRYDELVSNEIPNIRQALQDTLDEQIGINIKKFNLEVEVNLSLKEATQEWNKWKAKVLEGIDEEDILGNAKAKLQDFSSYYNELATGTIQVQARHLEDTLNELKKMDAGLENVYGDNRTAALEDLQKYYKQLMDDLEGVLDLQNEIHEAYISMMDEAQDKFDEQVKTYELVGDLLENNRKVIELYYGEQSYQEFTKYYEQEYDNNLKRLDFLNQQKQLWRDQMSMFEEGSKEWEAAKEKWVDAEKELADALEESLENVRESFENTIKGIFKDLNNLVTNDLGLDYTKEQWDLINRNSEEYLDTINAVAGIHELEAKYIKAINDNNSPRNQQRLNNLMEEELTSLREMDKLSQDDLDRAELKYQIALAQIALEDAQQQKNKMRLRRDSQGNYTYQYIADEDAINKAKEDLDKLYVDLYNFDKEKYMNNLDSIYSIWEEYQEKMAEVALMNDPVERSNRELLLQEQYGELLNSLLEKNTAIRDNIQESSFMSLSQLYGEDLEDFTELNQEKRDSLLNEVGGAFSQLLEIYGIDAEAFSKLTESKQDDIINGLGNTFTKLTGFYNEDKENFNNLIEDNKDKLVEDMLPQWNSAVQQMADTITDKGGLEGATTEALQAIKDAIAQCDDQMNTLAETSNRTFTDLGNGIDIEIEKIQDLVKNNEELIKTYSDELSAVKDVCDIIDELIEKYDGVADAAKKATEEAYKYWDLNERIAERDYKDQEPSRSSAGDQANYDNPSNTFLPVSNEVQNLLDNNITTPSTAKSWAYIDPETGEIITGGVTYGMSSNNFGASRNLVNTQSVMGTLNGLYGQNLTNMANILTKTNAIGTNSGEVVQQEVHIEATFPGVKNAKEIEDALNNLVNSASQRAFEKR